VVNKAATTINKMDMVVMGKDTMVITREDIEKEEDVSYCYGMRNMPFRTLCLFSSTWLKAHRVDLQSNHT